MIEIIQIYLCKDAEKIRKLVKKDLKHILT